jgi:hypothetical protein
MIYGVQAPRRTLGLARLLCPAARAEHVLLAERLPAFEASPQEIHKAWMMSSE